jgi:hypothetical protein
MKIRILRTPVVVARVPFKTRYIYRCILEVEKKIEDFGNVFNSNYCEFLKQHDESI